MGYNIYAWFENGNFQLQIVDAKTESVCVSRSYQGQSYVGFGDKKEIQKLFRELLLLTCKQEMRNYRVYKIEPEHELRTSPVFDELIYT